MVSIAEEAHETVYANSAGVYHSAEITSYEAAAINAAVNIEIWGGTHTPPHAPHRHIPETEQDYQHVENMVAQLDPARGDVLFMETVDHHNETVTLHTDDDTIRVYVQKNEQARTDRTINPFQYAVQAALLKGIPVVAADMHADTFASYAEVVGLPSYETLDEGGTFVKAYSVPSHEGTSEFYVYHSLREEQAANTVKDYARNALPEIQANDTKPTYALLMGTGHVHGDHTAVPAPTAGLVTAFARMGLHVNARPLPGSDKAQDMAEKAGVPPRPAASESEIAAASLMHLVTISRIA